MLDAFMPMGIRTTSDHTQFGPGVATLAVLMSSQVLQVTPHTVGLIHTANLSCTAPLRLDETMNVPTTSRISMSVLFPVPD